MLKNFKKYHSLGNDFVIFDYLSQDALPWVLPDFAPSWSSKIVDICQRHTGIGADGVLIIHQGKNKEIPRVSIFNADGSLGQVCLNGLRSVAYYLFVYKNFPAKFTLEMADRFYECAIDEAGFVTMLVAQGFVEGMVPLIVDQEKFDGFSVSVGNPHYINLRCIDLAFLKFFGPKIESHPVFPHKTNVEFVWQDCSKDDVYHLLVYERGCGITQACSSGVAAVLSLLYQRKTIASGSKITVQMLGGSVTGWVDVDGVRLQADAKEVFSGVLV